MSFKQDFLKLVMGNAVRVKASIDALGQEIKGDQCTACSLPLNLVTRRKRLCSQCKDPFCSACLIRLPGTNEGRRCNRCRIFSKSDLDWNDLMQLRVRDLLWFMERHGISSHGLKEKEQLAELILDCYGSDTYHRSRASNERRVAEMTVLMEGLREEERRGQSRDQADSNQPIGDESVSNQSQTDQPDSNQSPTDQPDFNQSPVDQPETSQSTPDQPDSNQSPTDQSDASQPGSSQPMDNLLDINTEQTAGIGVPPPPRYQDICSTSQGGPFVSPRTQEREPTPSRTEAPPSSSMGAQATPESNLNPPPSATPAQPSPSVTRRVVLSELLSEDAVEALSIRQLKDLLAANLVDYKGCVEKHELVVRAKRLWSQHNEMRQNYDRVQQDEKLGEEESGECKICMDAPIDCVLLDCAHMVTCTPCGKRMHECPICRQYVVRAIRIFKG